MTHDELTALWDIDYKNLTPEQKEARQQYRNQFTRGRRFQARAPFKLHGWEPKPGYQISWSMNVDPGTILTCSGESMTFGDGVPAIKWTDADGKFLANDCLVWEVVGGMWGGMVPKPGLLEPLDP